MKTMRYLCLLVLVCSGFALCNGFAACKNAAAATYYVDENNPAASDSNPGTAAAPWLTINHAGNAKSVLLPGDTVLINSGTYREAVTISVSGTSGKPITFKAAPGAQVVLKGSAVLSANWASDSDPGVPPSVYETPVPASFFTGLTTPYISSISLNDTTPLQQIGPDPIYSSNILTTVGTGVTTMIPGSFYFDPVASVLYVKAADNSVPGPQCEIGVLPTLLTLSTVNYVTVSGIAMRYNRSTPQAGTLVLLNSNGTMDGHGNYIGCKNVIIDSCRMDYADNCGIAIAVSSSCMVSNCEASYNGDVGMTLNTCSSCTVVKCVCNFNNTRNFHTDYAAGGMKSIPNNSSCLVENNEFGYNNGPGIWFDTNNADTSIIGNVCHNNRGIGIMNEIDAYTGAVPTPTGPGHALIANNLVFSNTGVGVYLSSSQNDAVIYNTFAENNGGGLNMNPRGDYNTTVANDTGQDNLFLNNYTSNPVTPLLTPEVYDALGAQNMSTNYNFYQNGVGGAPVFQFEIGDRLTLPQWQYYKYQDESSVGGSLQYTIKGPNFQITDPNQTTILGFATPYPTFNRWTSSKPSQVGSAITSWSH